jgi:hypothetical protein
LNFEAFLGTARLGWLALLGIGVQWYWPNVYYEGTSRRQVSALIINYARQPPKFNERSSTYVNSLSLVDVITSRLFVIATAVTKGT